MACFFLGNLRVTYLRGIGEKVADSSNSGRRIDAETMAEITPLIPDRSYGEESLKSIYSPTTCCYNSIRYGLHSILYSKDRKSSVSFVMTGEYVKDQPAGFSNRIQRIAIVGVSPLCPSVPSTSLTASLIARLGAPSEGPSPRNCCGLDSIA